MSDPTRGELVTADSLRAHLSQDTRRDSDTRMAAWYSTSSEHEAFDEDAIRDLYKNAR